uniref:Phospholipase n=1 Tax=Neolamprologus brichardi TaxID=32507 RepID=A0A3Q4HWE4_NEOBR
MWVGLKRASPTVNTDELFSDTPKPFFLIASISQIAEGRPFIVVHHLSEIEDKGIPYFIPDVPVKCRLDNTEKHTTRSRVSVGTLYTLHLTHGQFHWTIKRKYKNFQEVHRDLYKHKMMLHLLPIGRFAKERQQLRNMSEEMPSLHGTERARRTSSKVKYLEEYLNCLLENTFCKNDSSMLEFLSISPLSFVSDLGPKGLEGYILKRSGGHRILGLNCIGHHQICFRWSRRWLVVKDSFLLYMKRDSGSIDFVLLFDPEFKTKVGRADTGTKYGVCFENFNRNLIIKCNGYRQSQWWNSEIKRLAETCDFLKTHRFEGFAPPRENTLTKWYVNGSGYFADLADALEQAKEEIFITDWWLSPEVFLKRPATNNYWRLDEILKRKAEMGVKVCVLLYKEVEMALGINSEHSKRTLMNMHPNIKVMRHPDHVSSVVFLWAHHEKMVAIDQTVAFVGGLDLAFGRWDDSQHHLTDLGLTETTDGVTEGEQDPRDLTGNSKLWLGKDYNNFIKRDWVQLDRPFEDNIDRATVPRMPWRDLSAAFHGKAARDVARHFIQRWNFTKIFKIKYKDDFYPYLLPKSHSTADSLPFTVPGSKKAKVQVLRSADRWSTGTCESSIHNAYIDTINKSEHYIYIENQFFISCSDQKTVHNGIGDAIVNRILRAYRYDLSVLSTGLHFTSSHVNNVILLWPAVKDQWTEYITLCGLRTHAQLSESPVTELIYVHSKTLIADDRCYIIGSANINDRSMLGSRDSELAVFVEDEERVPSIMGGEEYQAGPLTLALRKECFRVLVGAASDPSINIDDPISDEFFFLVWNDTAKTNVNIYDKVFKCQPCNSVHSMQALRDYLNVARLCDTDPEQAKEELKAIRGVLVHFPLKFLCEENLLPPRNTKEGMAPVGLWT